METAKFVRAEDTQYLYFRSVIQIGEGSIEIGIHPVIYGYRVRIGESGSMFCDLDLCGGDSVEMIEFLYNGCRQIIEGHAFRYGKFKPENFPTQNIKPFFKDMNFLKEFCEQVLNFRMCEIDVRRVEITREQLITARLTMLTNSCE